MEDEDFLRRPPAPSRYEAVSAVLMIPVPAVRGTLEMLRRAGKREACVFWYGARDGDVSKVLSIRSPVQTSFRGNYHVEPEAMSQLVRDIPETWRPLAQIHSHPGINTEHSRYDDQMISSRKILSIVFPFYGVRDANWPNGLGVHEWQNNYWHLLSEGQARTRLALQPEIDVEVRDFR